ncbi:MAG: hypothetical protein ACOC91_01570 [bacterium]
MPSLKTSFDKAAFGHPGSDTFWLLIWIIILDDERQREERRRKRRRAPRPPSGPRP